MTQEHTDYTGQDTPPIKALERPQPLKSMIAAASRLNSKKIKRAGGTLSSNNLSGEQGWQDDAWDLFDLIGEQHFLTTTLANRMGQARFFVAKRPSDDTADLVPVEEGPAVALLDVLKGTGRQLNNMAVRMGTNLSVAGEGYIIGVPKGEYRPSSTVYGDVEEPLRILSTSPEQGIAPIVESPDRSIAITDLEWRMCSVTEVRFSGDGAEVTISDGLGGGFEDMGRFRTDDTYLIRVWRPHPRQWWQADSPTRAVLPILRELMGLEMHTSAQIDSRLAGNGLLLFPSEAKEAILSSNPAAQQAIAEDPSADPVMEAIMDAMITPIKDRDAASAVVPLMLTIPSAYIPNVKHLSFDGGLNPGVQGMKDDAIRRLALGQDCPPELLTGVSGMNHWGAWLVKEDVVTTHLEPPLALLCDALTTQYLWPLLVEAYGLSEEDASQYLIWYDVDHLIMRPNRADDAKALHALGVLSDEALRDAAGFDKADAPTSRDIEMPPAVRMALEMVASAASLAQDPGIPSLVTQIEKVLAGEREESAAPIVKDVTETKPIEVSPSPEEVPADDAGVPDTVDAPAPDPAVQPSSSTATRVQKIQQLQQRLSSQGDAATAPSTGDPKGTHPTTLDTSFEAGTDDPQPSISAEKPAEKVMTMHQRRVFTMGARR